MSINFLTIRHPSEDHQDVTATVVASSLPIWQAKGWTLVEDQTPEHAEAEAEAAALAAADEARAQADKAAPAEKGPDSQSPLLTKTSQARSAEGNLAGA